MDAGARLDPERRGSRVTGAMANSRFDHLVVTAPDLDTGVAYVRAALGVVPQGGGEHPRMATHNRLVRLGDAAFLEVIAPNPAATPPRRPRWFALDEPGSAARPRLATWAANTRSLRSTAAACRVDLGAIEPMSRGALEWLITIRPDGRLPLGGLVPALIEWGGDSHPAASLPDSGCALLGLELRHPDPDQVTAVLESIGFDGPVTVAASTPESPPGLVAHLRTPSGDRRLEGPG